MQRLKQALGFRFKKEKASDKIGQACVHVFSAGQLSFIYCTFIGCFLRVTREKRVIIEYYYPEKEYHKIPLCMLSRMRNLSSTWVVRRHSFPYMKQLHKFLAL